MKIGIERYRPLDGGFNQIQIYYNIPEDGGYLDYLFYMNIQEGDRVYVDESSEICRPCRLKKILTNQFNLKEVNVYVFPE